jgi:hypothetical protein
MLGRALKAVRQNAVAWLALFVALTGTSIAATHYVITSTKQIKPSVLKALHGANGREGPPGKTGLRGETGEKGERGSQGPEGKQGPKGETGAKGENGSALAYAHVSALAGVSEAKGFEAAKVDIASGAENAGIYCISSLGVTPHNVVVSADARGTTEPAFATASLGKSKYLEERHEKGKTLCPGITQATVEVWQRKSGTFETQNTPFLISIN